MSITLPIVDAVRLLPVERGAGATDQAALERHFAPPHLAEWRSTWPTLGIGKRRLSVYGVGEPRMV